MTDHEPANADGDAVLRALAALAPGVGRDAERDLISSAFGPEPASLDAMPDVALWLVLKGSGGFGDTVEIDLRGDQHDPNGHDPSDQRDPSGPAAPPTGDEVLDLTDGAVRDHGTVVVDDLEFLTGVAAQGAAPAWPAGSVRLIDELDAYLRSALAGGLAAPGGRSRATTSARLTVGPFDVTGRAAVDPYWPRHLVRTGRVAEPQRPPRGGDELERVVHDRLAHAALIGDADLADLGVEIDVAVDAVARRRPVDAVARTHPALFAASVVRWFGEPVDLDDATDAPALTLSRRPHEVALAFDDALARLDKPCFRELDRREGGDPRTRFLRRVGLHRGLPAADIGAILDAVLASYWSGSTSGREVAADWLASQREVQREIGESPLRLLTLTDHGRELLTTFYAIVGARGIGGGDEPVDSTPPTDLVDDFSPPVVDAIAAWWNRVELPERAWGHRLKPVVRLSDEPGDGPLLELPQTTARWHLNGELLGYGSPSLHRTTPLRPAKTRTWRVTSGSARRRSPHDIVVRSAVDDRWVLVFDEHGRAADQRLPLGGMTATVIAPAGTRVSGEVGRAALVGPWGGHERIAVDLAGLDEISVTHRRATPVTVAVDLRLRSRTSTVLSADGRVGVALWFDGHRPDPAEVAVSITERPADAPPEPTTLGAEAVDIDRGAFRLDALLAPDGAPAIQVGPTRRLTVTVARTGLPPEHHAVEIDEPTIVVDLDELLNGTTPRALLEQRVADLAAALGSDDPRSADGAGGRWIAALAGASALDEWERHHGRGLRQWARVEPRIRNVEPLRVVAGPRRGPHRTMMTLVDAALIAELGGHRSDGARERINEAARLAPEPTAAAREFAAIYAETQRRWPELRFVRLVRSSGRALRRR